MVDSENASFHSQYVASALLGNARSESVAEVYLTVDADAGLRRTALRTRIKDAVLRVLEAAQEVSKLGARNLHKDAPLILKVDGYEIRYSLDLDGDCATVWSAEPAREDPLVKAG
jgi:hypothetical protein